MVRTPTGNRFTMGFMKNCTRYPLKPYPWLCRHTVYVYGHGVEKSLPAVYPYGTLIGYGYTPTCHFRGVKWNLRYSW